MNIQQKPVEYTVTAAGKTYDGSAAVDVMLEPTNLEEGDIVTITTDGAVTRRKQ